MHRSLLEGQIAELVEVRSLGLGVERELVGELAIELGVGERAGSAVALVKSTE